MPDETSTQVVILAHIKDAVDRIEKRLEGQDGRIRTAEVSIAVLQWAVGLVGSGSIVALAAYLYRANFQ